MVLRIVSIDAVGDAPSHVFTNTEQARPRTARQVASAPASTQPHIRARMVEARHVRVTTTAVRSPVRPATLWIRVVSGASARRIASRMVVRQRASLHLPAIGAGPEGGNAALDAVALVAGGHNDGDQGRASPPIWGDAGNPRQPGHALAAPAMRDDAPEDHHGDHIREAQHAPASSHVLSSTLIAWAAPDL